MRSGNLPEEKRSKKTSLKRHLKCVKSVKVKPLKASKLDVPSKKTIHNLLLCKDIRKIKKELQSASVFKASAIVSKQWKKVKDSHKKMKKYKDLYVKEKQRHEEAQQKCQENHMDEMEIISLHKKMQQDKSSRKDRCKGTPQRPLGVDIIFFWGNNLMRWQKRIEKPIAVLCQEGGGRSKKILHSYLYTMIG